jgi:hypothetical protein
MLGRRFLLLVAVLMGLTALAASVAPRDPAVRGGENERRRTPQAAAPAAPTPDPATSSRTVVQTVSADDARPKRIEVTAGDIVELEVEAPTTGSVELMGRIEALAPESPARFNLLADEPGDYPITLLEEEREIGVLTVRAATPGRRGRE